MIEKESQVRMIGYGAMLMESFVAIMALSPRLHPRPGPLLRDELPRRCWAPTAESASQAVASLGFTITPDQLTAAAAAVEEQTLIARTGGAPTLAVGMSQIFSEVLGGAALKAFWYHFAIMFEALFILTTVDAGTRVGRFMLQDTLGNLWKPFGATLLEARAWTASAAIVGAWGYLLYAGVNDPLGGINQLFPLFGIANQLLATVALTVAHDPADQDRPRPLCLGHGHPAGLGRRGHAHRELAEDLLRRPEAGLLARSAPDTRTRWTPGRPASAPPKRWRTCSRSCSTRRWTPPSPRCLPGLSWWCWWTPSGSGSWRYPAGRCPAERRTRMCARSCGHSSGLIPTRQEREHLRELAHAGAPKETQ